VVKGCLSEKSEKKFSRQKRLNIEGQRKERMGRQPTESDFVFAVWNCVVWKSDISSAFCGAHFLENPKAWSRKVSRKGQGRTKYGVRWVAEKIFEWGFLHSLLHRKSLFPVLE
jgi:hypothetical protein